MSLSEYIYIISSISMSIRIPPSEVSVLQSEYRHTISRLHGIRVSSHQLSISVIIRVPLHYQHSLNTIIRVSPSYQLILRVTIMVLSHFQKSPCLYQSIVTLSADSKPLSEYRHIISTISIFSVIIVQ
jgi:hypothetical protein